MIVNYYNRTERKGSWQIFDKQEKVIKTNVFSSEEKRVVEQFGIIGIRAENLFSHPVQLEAAVNEEGELQVFQAKDIELTDTTSLERPSEYKTIVTKGIPQQT